MKFLEENLLHYLRRPEFAELRTAFHTRTFAKGSLIYSPDEKDNLVFIVSSGRVRVYLAYGDKEFTLGILGTGDIYSSHTETFVQALDDVELQVIDVKAFRRRMVGDPEVTKAMVRVLGNILKASFAIIDGLVFKDANCRLIALLVTEARRHGISEPDGVRVDIDLPVEQVARLLGATRQTVSTLLNELVRAGLIRKVARGQYLIPDVEALDASADGLSCR
ncbi:MAG: Crp/Fnr family transcriptional regulator [Proteobacteria bacterium]|nr:Crp/Fnr family transcriptional regulator [Pseudomonadota bacterium]